MAGDATERSRRSGLLSFGSGEWQLGERQLDVKVEQPGDSNGVQLY